MSCISYSGSERATRSVGADQPLTMMWWARPTSLPGGQYKNHFGELNQITVGTLGTALILGSITTDYTGSTLTANVWRHFAWTVSGDSHIVYLDGVSDITATDSAASTTLVWAAFANDGLNQFIGQAATLKAWTAVLSQAEIQSEMRSRKPLRHADLTFWNHGLAGASPEVDHSGTGGNFSATGTTSDSSEDPGIPWTRRGYLFVAEVDDEPPPEPSAARLAWFDPILRIETWFDQSLVVEGLFDPLLIGASGGATVAAGSAAAFGFGGLSGSGLTFQPFSLSAFGQSVPVAVGAGVVQVAASAFGSAAPVSLGANVQPSPAAALGLGLPAATRTEFASGRATALGLGLIADSAVAFGPSSAASFGLAGPVTRAAAIEPRTAQAFGNGAPACQGVVVAPASVYSAGLGQCSAGAACITPRAAIAQGSGLAGAQGSALDSSFASTSAASAGLGLPAANAVAFTSSTAVGQGIGLGAARASATDQARAIAQGSAGSAASAGFIEPRGAIALGRCDSFAQPGLIESRFCAALGLSLAAANASELASVPNVPGSAVITVTQRGSSTSTNALVCSATTSITKISEGDTTIRGPSATTSIVQLGSQTTTIKPRS